MINVNGCVYCGILWREHGTRFDSLHPRGVHTYVAPDDKLRKERFLKRHYGCKRCGTNGRVNYSSGMTTYIRAISCPECDGRGFTIPQRAVA